MLIPLYKHNFYEKVISFNCATSSVDEHIGCSGRRLNLFSSSFVIEPQYVEVGMTSCPSDNNTDTEPDEELFHSDVEN
jgi:hypothetical protein